MVNSQDVNKLLSIHDGDMALLYLWFNYRDNKSLETAAVELNMTSAQIKTAHEKLSRLGLVPTISDFGAAPPVCVARNPETQFKDIVIATEKTIRRQLTAAELVRIKKIEGKLSYDVIMALLNYCEEKAEKSALGKHPNFKSIEDEAKIWVQNSIETAEEATAYIQGYVAKEELREEIKSVLNITRAASKSELEYIDRWIGLGFDEYAVAEAYDRMTLNVPKLSYPYLNAILNCWHSLGCHTVEEINKADPPKEIAVPAGKVKTNKPSDKVKTNKPSGDRTAEVEQMLKELENMRNAGK